MQAQFWLDKWDNQETGFHLGSVHPLLKKFYSEVFSPQKGVFVPLCGKSSDLAFFAEKGSYTLGCELSEKAVKAFFSAPQLVNKEQLQVSSSGGFQSYKLNNLELLTGDFFELAKEQLKACNTIYDRAALIALPETMRKNYVTHMKSLFPQAQMLLISLDYPQLEMKGPPFSVSQSEVEQLFSFAEIEKVYSKNILNKEPKFEARGLSYLNESAYIIQW